MTSGPVLFARYAYPSNVLGYCGPDRAEELLERVARRAEDPDLRPLLREFEGAWPYLEVIAEAVGVDDPLDPLVVEAYWIGNHLLDSVDPHHLQAAMEERLHGLVDPAWWARTADPIPVGSAPTHVFQVLTVSPWVGLLRSGWVAEPLRVLDRCRIRWGRVRRLGDGKAVVCSRALAWDGQELTLAPNADEEAVYAVGGRSLAPTLAVGDWVSLHWEWVCDRLSPTQLKALRDRTRRQLAAVNATAHATTDVVRP